MEKLMPNCMVVTQQTRPDIAVGSSIMEGMLVFGPRRQRLASDSFASQPRWVRCESMTILTCSLS